MWQQDKLILILSGKLKPYEKRVWLIDRRYITADSVLLLEVEPTWITDGFSKDGILEQNR